MCPRRHRGGGGEAATHAEGRHPILLREQQAEEPLIHLRDRSK
jgi:hypothetical protein